LLWEGFGSKLMLTSSYDTGTYIIVGEDESLRFLFE